MNNWKTSAFGIGAAVLLVVITFAVKHTIDPETLAVAAGMVGIGVTAKDANSDITAIVNAAALIPGLKDSAPVKEVLPIADKAIDLADAAHPTNVILNDIKTGIDALNSSIGPASAAPAKA